MNISIVISTYNGERYLTEQLNSIKNQTRQADEVIISDDCSEDGTVNLINDFISKNNLVHWKLTQNKSNKGWRKNFYELINQAQGDLIFTCDQDDIWDKNKLQIMEREMEMNPDIWLMASNYYLYYGKNDKKINMSSKDASVLKIRPGYCFFDVPYPGCTMCIRKELVVSTKEYWDARFPHDAFYWRMAIYNDQVAIISAALVQWRRHSSNTYSMEKNNVRSFDSKREWLDYAEAAVIAVVECCNKESKSNKYKRNLSSNLECIRLRKNLYDSKNPMIVFKLLQYIKNYPTIKSFLLDLYLVFFQRTDKSRKSYSV